jgi:hypothetical protein
MIKLANLINYNVIVQLVIVGDDTIKIENNNKKNQFNHNLHQKSHKN